MKPDYVKIIFIGIPATFLFWVATFVCSIVLVSNTGFLMPIWANNALTVLFIPTYLLICRKFAKQLRCELPVNTGEGDDKINKSIPQTSGIIALVTIVALVSTMVVCGVFFNVDVNKAYGLIVMPIALAASLAERYFRKRA
ncbi:MAG: hypothetical protein RW306_06040 [Geobacteraceae bacterium]|nr:hypothetical protein [Geobacteraceae bacterium]